ncbi:hypothetical protein DLJ54_06245 [Corynebacterium heidelbergense]|uniref:DUF4232 domain-containing protein n=2 Tax=Corynebacterium heidelbergense TaxID=2055947 RepID=A0A364V5G4_9CORY|nr:hypothetical protein DLJ54_06245 [Corynebacterium heidelbergense]
MTRRQRGGGGHSWRRGWLAGATVLFMDASTQRLPNSSPNATVSLPASRRRLVVASVAAATCLGLVSACGSQGGSTGGSQAPSQRAAEGTPAQSTQSSPTAGGGQGPSASPAPPGPTGDMCRSANLAADVTDEHGAAGSMYVNLGLTNTGSEPCTLQGYPGVSLVADNGATQLGKPAYRDGASGDGEPAVVRLDPQQRASAELKISRAEIHGAQSCQPTPAEGFRVFPPGETKDIVVAHGGLKGCRGDVGLMQVGPMRAT